jgi:hypothetical protein
MKRLCWVAGIILVVAAGACKKAKGPADVKSAEKDNTLDSAVSMKAVINGKPWLTDSAYSYYVASSTNDSDVKNLMIVAVRKDSVTTTIRFNIAYFTGKKEYVVNPPYTSIVYYKGNERHAASSGTFKITADTANLLSGNFYFIADSIAVTNGTFKVSIP